MFLYYLNLYLSNGSRGVSIEGNNFRQLFLCKLQQELPDRSHDLTL